MQRTNHLSLEGATLIEQVALQLAVTGRALHLPDRGCSDHFAATLVARNDGDLAAYFAHGDVEILSRRGRRLDDAE